jgi:hypothetical protein
VVAGSQTAGLDCAGAGLDNSTHVLMHRFEARCCSMVSCTAEAIKGPLVLPCQEVLPAVKAGLALQSMQGICTT